MNLRVDTDVVRGGGAQVRLLADRLASTMQSAETTLRSAADEVGQPAVATALDELLTTLTDARSPLVTNLDAFAREVQLAAEAIEQTDTDLADAAPRTP
jgi:hypothetical protein